MSALALGLTVLLALASPSSAAAVGRRQAGTVVSNCKHDFALTWNDGPYLWTDEIVDEFDCVGGKTTFFVSGNYESCIYSDDNVQRLRYAFEAGHQIASLGWSHADFSSLSNAQIDVEIQRTDEAIVKILGVKPKIFRAPTGSIPSSAATYIQNTYGKTIVSYDVDSGDANAGATTEDSYQFYANLASQGTGHPHLTLSHETEANALDALDQGTINLLGSAGIKLVTVAQCLDTAAYETVGNYGVRDSTWNCDASWSPSTPTCQQTYTASATDTTCTIIGAKFGLSGTDISLANPFLNCGSVWQWTPVCIPAASSTPTQVACVKTYTAVTGDTCSSIAAKFGTTEEDLFNANTFVTCTDIWAGTSLCIPAAVTTPSASCSTTYTAQNGDTCNSIAHQFGVTAAAVQAANTFLDCTSIWAWTPICIPAGGSVVTSTTTTSGTTTTTSTSTSTSTSTTSTTTGTSTSTTSTTATGCVSNYVAGVSDTCTTIGAKYGLTAADIKAANSFLDCSSIWQWTPICIPPGGSSGSTSTTTTTTGSSNTCVTTYTAASGDTCQKIATKYGLTSSAIQAANSFVDCSNIWQYTPICIPSGGTPATCTQTYVSQANDDCDSIGAKYGVTGAQILTWNSFLSCDDIWVGTHVCV